MDQLFNIVVVVVLVAVCVWWALRPNYVFLISFENGAAHLKKGKVTPEFISDVNEICGRNHVPRGWVGGIARGRKITLAFSGSIPPASRQQLRNPWSIHV